MSPAGTSITVASTITQHAPACAARGRPARARSSGGRSRPPAWSCPSPRARRFPDRSLVAILALLLALGLPGHAAGTRTPLERKLAKALTVPHVARSRSAALAIDLATGEPVYSQNARLSLTPASNEKLPLTLTALRVLGPSFRMVTEVLGEGRRVGSAWQGNLALVGRGDPTLSTGDLVRLARKLRALGIRRVSGSVLGDESFFDERRTASGWKAFYYFNESPPLSALAVDRCRARGVPNKFPALAAALAFRDALRAAGVEVAGRAREGRADGLAVPLAQVVSPRLANLLRFMDRESDNFTAELLLKQLGAVAVGRGTSAAGAGVVTRELAKAGVPLTGVRIVDGSGLSHLDRLTVQAIVAMLQSAWADPVLRRTVLAALPVAGVSGTLEDRMRTTIARGAVLAKTGTTRDASALAGFVRGRYVFALLQNGHPLSYWWARVAQDRFAVVLAAQ